LPTDVTWNGDPWFKVAFGNDKHWFQWGGISAQTVAPDRPDILKMPPERAAPEAGLGRSRGLPRRRPIGFRVGVGRARVSG
jgi:hypothetical protein